jgi:hypothetical protein
MGAFFPAKEKYRRSRGGFQEKNEVFLKHGYSRENDCGREKKFRPML